MTGRREARRTALFLLYQWDLTGQPLASLFEGEVDPFAKELAETTSSHAGTLDGSPPIPSRTPCSPSSIVVIRPGRS